MARLLFPDAASVDRVQATAGTALLSAAGAKAVVYLDAAGTQVADITYPDGSAVPTAGTLTLDNLSRLPGFLGPTSGAQVLYVRVDGGAPLPVMATVDARLDAQDVDLAEKFTAQDADVDQRLAAQAADAAATYIAKTDKGVGTASLSTATFDGAPATVVQAPAAPAPQDKQAAELIAPVRGAVRANGNRRVGRANSGADVQVQGSLHVSTRRNLWQYTEDFASNRYTVSNSTKGTDTIVVDGITLTRWSSANFFGNFRSALAGFSIAPFTAGQRYLFSFYAVARHANGEQFVWHYPLANGNHGFGARLVDHRPRRLWFFAQATDASRIDQGRDPLAAIGAATGGDTTWVQQGTQVSGGVELYVGGFQIERVADTYVDGIAMIGDSTMAGSANKLDVTTSREVSRYLEGMLNASVFNRAVGGETTADMDARWATDITPIKHRCKYVVIQGGINDIGGGRTLADIQASINSMVTKAATDGLLPVLFTCTPTKTIAADAAKETLRTDLNNWLRATFPRVIDIATVIEDPYDARYVRRDADWYGDGVHYTEKAKRAVAAYAASWSGWDFAEPSPYQPIPVATFDAAPSAVFLSSPNGTRYKLTVSDVGAVTVTAG